MPQRCTVCEHPERELIHAALAGESINATAARFDLSATSLRRHLNEHSRTPGEGEPEPTAAPGLARSTPGRPCSICSHPAREAIERLITVVGGLSRATREVNGCPDRRSLRRHRDTCMAGVIQQRREQITEGLATTARERAEVLYREATSLLRQARHLVREAKASQEDTATRAKALQAAAAVVGKAAPIVELLGRMTGELRPAVSVKVILESTEFKAVLQELVAAISPFGPEALSAVAEAVRKLEGGPAPPARDDDGDEADG